MSAATSSKQPPTPAERIAIAQAKRAALRKAESDAHAEQQATDIEALADLEAMHGFDRVLRIDLAGWAAGRGAATLIAVRVPTSREAFFRKFESMIASAEKGQKRLDALHELARSCLVYPAATADKVLHDATLELAPGVLSKAGELIINAAQGKADDEKKE